MLSALYVNIYTVGAIFTAVVSYFILIYKQVFNYYHRTGEYEHRRPEKSNLLIVNIGMMFLFSLAIGGAWFIFVPTWIIVLLMMRYLKKVEE